MTYIFSNNAITFLAAEIDASETAVLITPGDGDLFPNPAPGQSFVVTVQNGAAMEIMECTARVGDILTVVRARDNTAAQIWAEGSSLDLRIPAMVLNAMALGAGTLNASGGTMSGPLLLDDLYSLSVPVLAFDGDTNTGIGRYDHDSMILIANGVARVNINATNTVVQGVLQTSGSTEVGGDLTVSGNFAIGGAFNAVSTLKAETLESVGTTKVGTDLTVGLDMTVGKNVAILGAFDAKSTVIAETLESRGGTKVGHALFVGLHTTIGDGCGITGDLTVDGDCAINGAFEAAEYIKGLPGIADNMMVAFEQFPSILGNPGASGLPTGVLEKWGQGSTTGGTGTVVFAAPFPTSADNVQITIRASGTHVATPLAVGTDLSATGFSVYGKAGEALTFFWRATGH